MLSAKPNLADVSAPTLAQRLQLHPYTPLTLHET